MNAQTTCHNCETELTVPECPSLSSLVCPLCQSQNDATRPQFPPGALLSSYRILQNIGTYPFHEIYHAQHLGYQRDVTLQTFTSPGYRRGMPADYFLTAMREWLKVDQPNIVKVTEAGRNRAGLYFAAHLPVEGITLEDNLRRGKSIALKPALHLAVLICRILKWLYDEHGIIYGSLNPRNIILTPLKDIYLAHKVLAPILKDRPPGLPLSELATGLPGYMSPEQLASSDHLDCQSDMFSLGATLYHMLTGKSPYHGLNRSQIQRQHKTPSLPDPRTLSPDLPDRVIWLLDVLMAYNPHARFASWDILIDILTHMEPEAKRLSLEFPAVASQAQ